MTKYTVAQGGKCAYKLRDTASAREAVKIAGRWTRSGPACLVTIRKYGAPTYSGDRTYRTIMTCRRGICEKTGWWPHGSSFRSL